MVSWLPHAVVPGLVALAFFPIERKRILWLLPVVWLPDVDYLVPGLHRAATTNVWIPALLLGAVALLWRRRGAGLPFWRFAVQPGWPASLLLAGYYWASHVILDVFAGGAVLFWPVWDRNFYWFYEIRVDTATNTFEDTLEVGTEAGAPGVSPTYTWFTGEHNAIFWFLVVCAAVGAWVWWRRRVRNIQGAGTTSR